MNLNLLDPKLIEPSPRYCDHRSACWLYVRKRGVRRNTCGKSLAPSTTGRC